MQTSQFICSIAGQQKIHFSLFAIAQRYNESIDLWMDRRQHQVTLEFRCKSKTTETVNQFKNFTFYSIIEFHRRGGFRLCPHNIQYTLNYTTHTKIWNYNYFCTIFFLFLLLHWIHKLPASTFIQFPCYVTVVFDCGRCGRCKTTKKRYYVTSKITEINRIRFEFTSLNTQTLIKTK